MTPVRHPQMTPPSATAALARLFAGGETLLEGEAGKELPASLLSLDGERAVATLPRLDVACETRLFGRLIDESGEPWRLTLEVDRADYHSQELAAVQLRVTAVERDQTRRRAQRVPAGGRAWLEAVSCQEVVDG